jgi:hypothetical protein
MVQFVGAEDVSATALFAPEVLGAVRRRVGLTATPIAATSRTSLDGWRSHRERAGTGPPKAGRAWRRIVSGCDDFGSNQW